VIFRACSLENEVGDPPIFFYIFDITKPSSYTGESLRQKSMLENFRANVLKFIFTPTLSRRNFRRLWAIQGDFRQLKQDWLAEKKNIATLGDLRGYGTLKYGDVHEKFNFSEMQESRPLRTCQKHFETILPNFLLDECEI